MDVQEDATDTPEAGTRVVQLLRGGWPTANVESQVQKISPQNMPNVAQVRYFNASDEVFMNRCVEILKQASPDARAVRIGLPSPEGQLELWLPRKTLVRLSTSIWCMNHIRLAPTPMAPDSYGDFRDADSGSQLHKTFYEQFPVSPERPNRNSDNKVTPICT